MQRVIGGLIAVIPFAVIAYCLTEPARVSGPAWRIAGWVAIGVGAWLCLLNAYASWIRPRLFLWRGGRVEDYKFVSGFPVLGTWLVTVGLVLLPPSLPLTLGALLLVIVDTGGWHWFVVSTWTDADLWRRDPEA